MLSPLRARSRLAQPNTMPAARRIPAGLLFVWRLFQGPCTPGLRDGCNFLMMAKEASVLAGELNPRAPWM